MKVIIIEKIYENEKGKDEGKIRRNEYGDLIEGEEGKFLGKRKIWNLSEKGMLD